MGNKSIANQFKSGKWKKIEFYPNYEVIQNIETRMKIQRHSAKSDFENFDDRYQNTELYNWRKALDPRVNVVKLYEFEIKQEMFGIQQKQFVYTEKINRINSKSIRFSKPEAFLLLLDFLRGLELLFSVFGVFNIDIFLFGISDDGKGKVWVNQNYAKNQVEDKNIIEEPNQNTEIILVNNIITLVKDRTWNPNFMPEIQFPLNTNIKDTMEYIEMVQSQQFFFQVDKIYLNINEFQQAYEELTQVMLESSRSSTQGYIQPLTNNQRYLPVQKQKLKEETRINRSRQKNKVDPNETLSSDSNSRSRNKNLNFIQTQVRQSVKKNIQNQRKIHISKIQTENKQIQIVNSKNFLTAFEKEEIPLPRNQSSPFSSPQHNFIQRQIINPQPIFIQQNPINLFTNFTQAPNRNQALNLHHQTVNSPYLLPHQTPINDRNRQFVVAQNPQYIQGLPHLNKVIQNQERPEIFQKKVIKYQTVTQPQTQQLKIYPENLNHKNQKNMIPIAIKPNSARHQIVENGVFQNLNNMNKVPKLRKQEERQLILNKKQVKRSQNNMENQKDENFISNVELCESVIFDMGQIQENLAALQR